MTAHINKTVCACCGAVLELTDLTSDEQENFLPCVLPTSFEWTLPAGRIVPVVGDPIYVDAFGHNLTKDEFMTQYNVDPEIAYQKMRAKVTKEPVPLGEIAKAETQSEEPKRKPLKLGRY